MARRAVTIETSSELFAGETGYPDFSHEQMLLSRGARLVAGVDEAGRGPLAGPVVVAAVRLDPELAEMGLAGRIALARSLLVDRPHLTIIEVAYACGFDGVSTFYRVFKAQTGATASEYRREIVGARMAERQQPRRR